MAKKSKHRLVIDVTFSEPLTENRAARAVRVALSSLWAVSNGYRLPNNRCNIDKLDVKEFSRVLRAAKEI